MRDVIWSDGVENALNEIHKNSLAICEYHTGNYARIKGYQKYFRVPIIVLSGVNSVFSVGLQPYMSQQTISLLCCAISLLCGIVSSLELFVGIQSRMEKELMSSKEFYILACDIFKVLSVEREHRTIDGHTYLDAIHNKYCSLVEQSDLVDENNTKYKLQILFIDVKNKNSLLFTVGVNDNNSGGGGGINGVIDNGVSDSGTTSDSIVSNHKQNEPKFDMSKNFISSRIFRNISTTLNTARSPNTNTASILVSESNDTEDIPTTKELELDVSSVV